MLISKIAWLLLKKYESFFDYLSLHENASSKARSLSLNHFENLGKNARSSRHDATPLNFDPGCTDHNRVYPKVQELKSLLCVNVLVGFHPPLILAHIPHFGLSHKK